MITFKDVAKRGRGWLPLIGFTDHLPMWRNTVKGHNSEARVFSELGRVDTFWLDR